MDAPWNYDKEGQPIDADTRAKIRERQEYVNLVSEAEKSWGFPHTIIHQ